MEPKYGSNVYPQLWKTEHMSSATVLAGTLTSVESNMNVQVQGAQAQGTRYLARHRSRETMLRRGFVEVPMSERWLADNVDHVLKGMYLMTEDKALGEQFPWHAYTADEYGRGYEQEVGLEHKVDDEKKWKFQYMSAAYGRGETAPSALKPFFCALHELESEALALVLALAEEFDDRNRAKSTMHKYPGRLKSKLARATCVTRILRYPKWIHATQRAKTHIDRSFMTAHWFGTHEGLMLYTPNGAWERINETSCNNTVLFPGEKFAATTRSMLGTYGTPHGVWCDENLTEDRYAIVSFVHPQADNDDCAWLSQHKHLIKEFEDSLVR